MNSPVPLTAARAHGVCEALRRYGVEAGELAAIRAFARVVPQTEFARLFAIRLAATALRGAAAPHTIEAEAQFCAELAANESWSEVEAWFARLSASWLACIDAGSEPAFAFEACAALVKAAGEPLAGERTVIYRLELDILIALEAFTWGIASLLVDQALRREGELRRSFDDRDELTGLANRRHYSRRLAAWLEQASPQTRVGLVVLAMEWGVAVQHLPLAQQDRLRLAVAERLREAVRPGDLLCVTGDHEWSLLLPALRSPAQVRLAANKLVAACEALLDGEFRQLCGRLSAGGAVAPDHGKDLAALEHAARTALVVARQSGLRFEDYRAEFTGAVDDCVGFERDLLNAIHTQGLELYLQPQVRLVDDVCESAELLLRWQRQPGEWVAPPDIVEGAQRLGLLPQLSRWLIMRAARISEKLRQAGVRIRVNLNLTAIDLRDDELPDMVEQAITTWQIAPADFGLEVTETALLADQHKAAQLIGRIRRLGCPVALDDFGTGFSSLAYLRNLPVTELKIDQMFVRHLRDSAADQSIVGAIMLLARGFGLRVVAEGVEDETARELLREAGCDLMQGFLTAPAMPLESFVGWWRRREVGGAGPGAQ